MAEELQEVGYRHHPPLLGDVAVTGPCRTVDTELQDTMAGRTVAEEDYNWFKYSTYAKPFLYIIFFGLALLMVLSINQGMSGTSSRTFDGLPRETEFMMEEDGREGNLRENMKSFRTAASVIGIVSFVWFNMVLFVKPRPGLRKIFNLLGVLMLLTTCTFAWLSFGWDVNDADNAFQCAVEDRVQLQRSASGRYVVDPRATQFCHSRKSNEGPRFWAWMLVLLDALLGFHTLVATICFALWTLSDHWHTPRTGWKEQGRDAQDKNAAPKARSANLLYVRETRMTVGHILLWVTLALSVGMLFLTLNRNRQAYLTKHSGVEEATNPNGATYQHPVFVPSGWPEKNTGMRLIGTISGLVLIILNFLPIRSAVVASVFSYLHLVVDIILFIAFGFDLAVFTDTLSRTCPGGFDCTHKYFLTTVMLEGVMATVLLLYLLHEYWLRPLFRCPHCNHTFAPLDFGKHQGLLCGSRPVVCSIDTCRKTMSAKRFTLEHRYVCGADYEQCNLCAAFFMATAAADHANECLERPVACPDCGQPFLRKYMSRHQVECPEREITCSCGDVYKARDQHKHMQVCMNRIVTCEVCGHKMPAYKLEEHLRSGCVFV
jgi:hypothetical protein